MENFNLSYEWRQEKNQLYVQSTSGIDDPVAVQLNVDYRNAAEAYNLAQIAYNNRQGAETSESLAAAKDQYEIARASLLEFINNKPVDSTEP